MTVQFDFSTAGRIIFRAGAVQDCIKILPEFGEKPVLVTGMGSAQPEIVISFLRTLGMEWEQIAVDGEPTIDFIQSAVLRARESRCDFVVAIGGGSVLDSGKALGALLANPGDVLDFLEVVGKNQPLRKPGLPCVAIPTTAGTGSEVTRNAVLSLPEQQVKVSLRSPWMLPRIALVDPELTYSMPPELTASTGMDALIQVFEPFVSLRANALTDMYCREGMTRAARSLRAAYTDGQNADAREDMAFTSLLGGMALANAGLGAVHGFAAPVGGMFAAPHGAVCAALLPAVTAVNIRALRQRQPDNPVLERFREAARILTEQPSAKIDDCPRVMQEMVSAMRIPGLSSYGLDAAAIPVIVERAAQASSMKANPIMLTSEELAEILERSL